MSDLPAHHLCLAYGKRMAVRAQHVLGLVLTAAFLGLLVPVAAVAEAPAATVQLTDQTQAEGFGISARFEILSRGATPAAQTAGPGDLYLDDQARITVEFREEQSGSDLAELRCFFLSIDADGAERQITCNSGFEPTGKAGGRGVFRIGFTAVITDPSGMWTAIIGLTAPDGKVLGQTELRFNVHTEQQA